jgi:ribosomal protein S18 acetylase RimI-like enzyme
MAKLADDKREIYKKWKSLVNMSYGELKKFYESKEGKEAGLSSSEAKEQGIDSGRESARWIMKMKTTPVEKWTPTMWKWASKQISFISRMSGNKGGLYDDKGNKTRKHTSLLIWGNNPEKFKDGGRTVAQTPAPKKDRIYGSKVNPKGSASSEKSAKEIKLSPAIIASLTKKLKEFREKYPSKKNITISDLKAVYRRGSGAYSKSHRPTISGGKPNTRNAWSMARVNAFLKKAGSGEAKEAYVQDDDLLKYADGGYLASIEQSILNLKKNGIVLSIGDVTLICYNTGNQNRHSALYNQHLIYKVVSNIDKDLASKIIVKFNDGIYDQFDEDKIGEYKKSKHLIVINQNEVLYDSSNPDTRYSEGGEIDGLINDGIVELKMYDTEPEHAKIYGFDAQRPLYIQTIIVSEEHRGKGIGTKVIKYIVDYAMKNQHDVILGHITQHAEPSIDVIKSMLVKSGFNTIECNNDFYKLINNDDDMTKYDEGGGVSDFSKVISKSSRFRPRETIVFDPPLVGLNGNKLISYTWSYEWTEDWSTVKGEPVSKRVSDWTQAELSADTGRQIVHQYGIQMADGTYKTVSSESVPVVLGYIDRKQSGTLPNLVTASKTLAKQKMQLAILEAKKKEKEEAIKEIKSQPFPPITIDRERTALGTRFVMGNASVWQNDGSEVINQERKETLTNGYINRRLEEMGISAYDMFNTYELKNRIARQERKIQSILENKMEDGGTTNKNQKNMDTPLNIILEEVKPLQEELTQKWIESVKEEGKVELKDWMVEDYKFMLVMDLVKAIGNYLEPTDKVKFLNVSRSKGSVAITAVIEREGKTYDFSTEMIYAGGYNIQKLHFRYIVKTQLPHRKTNTEYQKLNEQYKGMTKAQKLREDIGYAQKAIERYTLKMNEAKENSKLSDAQVEAISREDEPDKWVYADMTWATVIKNGADKNFNYDENEFNRSQKEDKIRLLKSWRLFNANFKEYEDRIKREQKEIDKLNKKLSDLGYDSVKYDGGGSIRKSEREETQENNFGVRYKLGDKFTLSSQMSNRPSVEVSIVEIMPSGLFFKVDKSKNSFSIKTLHSKGSTYTSGEYLIPIISSKMAHGGAVDVRTLDTVGRMDDSNFADIAYYKTGGLIAPNGKPSNLTAEQYRLVRTPEFKAWFGDWEYDPENASKVVDENGEPLVVWHGFKDKWWLNDNSFVFNPLLEGRNTKVKKRPLGAIYFSSNIKSAKSYSNDVFPFFLNFRNPKIIDGLNKDLIYVLPFLYQRKENVNYYDDKDLIVKNTYDYYMFKYKKEDLTDIFVTSNIFNKIKIADGSNTTFDGSNADVRYDDGGNIETYSSTQIDTKVHQIAMKNKLPIEFIEQELKHGIKTEIEHTDDKSVATKIALDHLSESPIYYQKLKQMEHEIEKMNPDTYLPRVMAAYANGGTIDMIYKMNTPTKEPTKLNYIQQILVRTKEFKAWFGDWERAAQNFLMDGRENFKKHYAECSIVVDPITLEPQVVYHGTNYKEEFYQFDVTKEQGIGRPYGYFADNIEYSQNFTSSSQRGQEGKELLYKCFLNIKNPFFAIDDSFLGIEEQPVYWLAKMANRIVLDKYGEITQSKYEEILEVLISQIFPYMVRISNDGNVPFWMYMARDSKKEFKYFLMSHGYDGVRYGEEFKSVYDINNPREFTKAWTIFDASQVKLADGRNIDFNPMSKDIRYETGGQTEENIEDMQQNSKAQVMRSKLGLDKYAEGGHVKGDGKATDNGKKGGYFEGRSHAEGGIKAVNKDTGQLIEVEGDEVIINKRSVADQKKREFEGQMLTNREILSKINQMGGGVAFADGGEIHAQMCKCNGKKYKFGGDLVPDYDIVKQLTSDLEPITKPVNESVSYIDGLISRMYQK